MWKTILILVICLIFAAVIATTFTIFLTPPKAETVRYASCILLQNSKTGAVDCYGCYNNICKDATPDWKPYQKPQVGIPYACIQSAQGCSLAQ